MLLLEMWRTQEEIFVLKVVFVVHYLIKSFSMQLLLEAATGGVLLEKVFLKISQSSQENTCARGSFFNEVAG